MKFAIAFVLNIFFVTTAFAAGRINMIGQNKYGYAIPQYEEAEMQNVKKFGGLTIMAIADENNFPFSSVEQGSVFNKIFGDFVNKIYVQVGLLYRPGQYEEAVQNFERGGYDQDINAHFGLYYDEYPYSHNQYVYPAFMDNNVFIITSADTKWEKLEKNDLKNYRGVHAKTDKISNMVKRDFENLGIEDVKDFPAAFEELLTGKADYIAASYYQSAIEAYKLGVREYVTYSKIPLWKMPMFIRVHSKLKKHPQMEEFEHFLKSQTYKKARDKAFEEMLNMYKESTKGVIAPTYNKIAKKAEPKEETLDKIEEKPMLGVFNITDELKLEN